ncbi:MAG: ribose 5-phosphate isomerase B [Coriobacteriia bacterium]|nr:ribose 5-phosphate isomerase B [Coriobacteriia bacterium]MCL2537063.1 ribose 5-phosphate isomerase B [Coriobacteriia bacterium]
MTANFKGARIAIASDHGGFEQKESLKPWLVQQGYSVKDLGPDNEASVDYPDYAHIVAKLVARGEADAGILVCGTGLGMSIAANKVKGIRAVPVTTPEFAQLAREHNDANVLCLSGRFVDDASNKHIVQEFLTTDFAEGRHARRVAKFEDA